jgi:hypothetical protein
LWAFGFEEVLGGGESLASACGPMTMMLSDIIYLLEGVILSTIPLLFDVCFLAKASTTRSDDGGAFGALPPLRHCFGSSAGAWLWSFALLGVSLLCLPLLGFICIVWLRWSSFGGCFAAIIVFGWRSLLADALPL